VRRRSGIARVVKLTDRDHARGAAPARWARRGHVQGALHGRWGGRGGHRPGQRATLMPRQMGTGVGGATPADQTCIGVVHGGFFTVVGEAKVDIDRGGKRIGVGSAVLAGRAHAGAVHRRLFTVGEAEADCRVSVAWSRGWRCCHQLGWAAWCLWQVRCDRRELDLDMGGVHYLAGYGGRLAPSI
jgi:hypothetical protein